VKKLMLVLVAGIALSGCSKEFVENYRYIKEMENRPRSWSAIGQSPERAQDFHMWKLRQRCKINYSFECLEMDIHGDRRNRYK